MTAQIIFREEKIPFERKRFSSEKALKLWVRRFGPLG